MYAQLSLTLEGRGHGALLEERSLCTATERPESGGVMQFYTVEIHFDCSCENWDATAQTPRM